MYHIDEGKRWRVGSIFVHIDGEIRTRRFRRRSIA